MNTLLETPEYQAALSLWARGEYWEVHEALEPLWLRLSGPERQLTQGIILLAAALHKAKTSPSGGWRNFHKALKHLETLPAIHRGIEVAKLIEEVKQALEQPTYSPPWSIP
jgi:predicted metal-dependent hydrolase